MIYSFRLKGRYSGWNSIYFSFKPQQEVKIIKSIINKREGGCFFIGLGFNEFFSCIFLIHVLVIPLFKFLNS